MSSGRFSDTIIGSLISSPDPPPDGSSPDGSSPDIPSPDGVSIEVYGFSVSKIMLFSMVVNSTGSVVNTVFAEVVKFASGDNGISSSSFSQLQLGGQSGLAQSHSLYGFSVSSITFASVVVVDVEVMGSTVQVHVPG